MGEQRTCKREDEVGKEKRVGRMGVKGGVEGKVKGEKDMEAKGEWAGGR